MTRKHFRILADALGRDMWRYVGTKEEITSEMVTDRYGYTIEAMYECNPGFHRKTFINAIMESAQKQQGALDAALKELTA